MSLILSEDILTRARQYRGAGDSANWQVGDLAIDVVDELKGKGATQTEIRSALADELGLSRASVTKIERAARAFDEADRDEFSTTLTFDYFLVALGAPAPRQALQWCVESGDDFGGKPAPLDRFRAHIRELKQGRELTFDEQYELSRQRAANAVNAMLRTAPEHKARATRAVLEQIEKL